VGSHASRSPSLPAPTRPDPLRPHAPASAKKITMRRTARLYDEGMRGVAILVVCAACGGSKASSSPDASSGPDGTESTPDANPAGVWHPMPGTSWQWQLSGTIDTSFDVAMYDIDMFEAPQQTIDALHNAGRKVVCYVDAGTWEPNRPDSSQFDAAVQGAVVQGWPGEKWLDIRAASVTTLIDARIDLAMSKRCDGVELDNVDGYANTSGFPLTASDQLAFNSGLAAHAHARGLSVGLKNDLDQIPYLLADFDWALDEQCFQFNECDMLTPFIGAQKAVFEVEYGSPSLATTVCPMANSRNFDTLIKNLALDAPRTACR
jgi:hypothetical protein